MRIKRFIAPDIRTALRMVRDQQGPDAVILSNRTTPEGVEIVTATDYDEAMVSQALRAAAPAAETPSTDVRPARAPAHNIVALPTASASSAASSRADAMIAALSTTPTPLQREAAPAPAPAPVAARAPAPVAPRAAAPNAARESLAERARAVCRIDEQAVAADAALARAHAPTPTAPPAFATLLQAQAAAPAPARAPEAPPAGGDEFRALLARLTEAETADATWLQAGPAAPAAAPVEAVVPAAPAAVVEPVRPAVAEAPAVEAEVTEPVAATAIAPAAPVEIETPRVEPVLRAVAAPAEDPSLVAMRNELAMMRELIERQMDHYAIERLRGSAGRAHVFDTLVACGCDEGVAQSVATRIDASMTPDQTRELMFVEFARMIVTNRSEPIDEGGVIALVGPTGAGKTTTAAKLAARFAARHRARDVALVTTDTERAAAREQLHMLGRRLGITVCEAEGPERLNETLAQLSDYPLVLVDTAGYAARDRALLGQILWLRTARRVRSLLVLPANAHPHDMAEVVRRYRPASPEGVVLTKTDETGRLGAALSVLVKQDMSLAYTTGGQQVPSDIEVADAMRLSTSLEKLRRAGENPLHQEDRHAIA